MFQVADARAVFLVTDTAAAKVKDLIAAEDTTDELALRVAVRPGGCSGFSYEMFFDTDIAADDQVFEYGEVKVIVDPTVLCGVVTQVGDTVIDGTVRHRLEQLREVF